MLLVTHPAPINCILNAQCKKHDSEDRHRADHEFTEMIAYEAHVSLQPIWKDMDADGGPGCI
jgi:hypothetical protein